MESDRPFLDLGHARTIKGRGISIRLSAIERWRAARGIPQAVVKVVSYARGEKRVRQLMEYISRDGALELETDTGERLLDRDQSRALAQNWAADFGDRKNSRDAAHIVFSMPPGSDPEALRKAVRRVGAKFFPEREWVFAIHQDRKHPHAHMVVKMRGRGQEMKLRLNKPELYKLREVFAEAAREQGVQLAASPRAARGIGQKGDKQAIYYMRRRGVALVEREESEKKPWEDAIKRRNGIERQVYQNEARLLREKAKRESGKKRDVLLQVAANLERFSKEMPVPKTRRQAQKEKQQKKIEEQRIEKVQKPSQDAGLER